MISVFSPSPTMAAAPSPAKYDNKLMCSEIHLSDSYDIDSSEDPTEYSDEQLELITRDAIKLRAKRGDIIVLDVVAGYRNTGKLVFDGTSVINLDDSVDDYGAIPPSFHVLDEKDGFLPPTYWNGAISHNNIVYFNPSPFIKDIIRNISSTEIKETKAFDLQTTFKCRDQTVTIRASCSDDDACATAESVRVELKQAFEIALVASQKDQLFECCGIAIPDTPTLYLPVERKCPTCSAPFNGGGNSSGVYLQHCENGHQWEHNDDGAFKAYVALSG